MPDMINPQKGIDLMNNTSIINRILFAVTIFQHSNEISHQLSNFIQTKRFFMTSYLVFSLVYCNTFEGMPPRGNVNFNEDPTQFWYPMLWRHKAPFHFYEIQDSFVREFRCMLTGMEPDKLTEAVVNFLVGKGVYIFEEKFTYIRLFGFEGKPFLLPCFVCDIFFIYELCRQYKVWSTFFDKKRKKQFIPMPFKIVGILVKSSSNLAEMVRYFDSFHMKEVEAHKGFDQEGIFMTHMVSIGYSSFLLRQRKSQREQMIMKTHTWVQGWSLRPVKLFLRRRSRSPTMIQTHE
jgi:hypothetical protein